MNELPKDIGGYQHIENGLTETGDIWVDDGVPVKFVQEWSVGVPVIAAETLACMRVYRKMPQPGHHQPDVVERLREAGLEPTGALLSDAIEHTNPCIVCAKPITGKQRSAKYCGKTCKQKADKKSEMVRYYASPENREKHLSRSRAYAASNPQKNRDRVAAWRKANPEKRRIWSRKRQGMINPPGHVEHGPCESCKAIDNLVLDHDHSSGKVRGWLCGSCNRALGQARDSVVVLQSLISYLTKFQ